MPGRGNNKCKSDDMEASLVGMERRVNGESSDPDLIDPIVCIKGISF